MSYSTYVTTWNNNPINQVNDMINKSVIKSNSRIILAFASFNFTSTDYVPGILNMNLDDLKKFTDLVHSVGGKVSLSIGGATYPFNGSDLFNRPGDLAANINILLNKCGFDGVDFDIEDSFSNAESNFVTNAASNFVTNAASNTVSNTASNFVTNAASLINTLKSLNNTLNITLTTAAQAWAPNNYQQSLLDLTIGNLNAWQPMEYDLWIDPSLTYYDQIEYDINYYLTKWNINSNKIILGLMPGSDDLGRNLNLQYALDLTSFAKTKNLQGVMTWSANIDSVGCDGNAPYAYSLGIQSILKSTPNIFNKMLCCKTRNKIDYKLGVRSQPPLTLPVSPKFTNDEIKKK